MQLDTSHVVAAQSGPVTYDRRREYDLTGDGVPEVITLRGAGPAWDALDMRIEIRSPAGVVLYADSFTTRGYTGLDPDPQMTAASKEQWVKQQLESDLADDAFTLTEKELDNPDGDMRDAYAEAVWKEVYSPSMSDMQRDSVRRAIEMLDKDPGYIRFRADLGKRPMYRYYIGGESATGITWSSVLNRFVVTYACC